MNLKRNMAFVICLVFCMSLFGGVITHAEPEQEEQKITSIEELPEEIRNSNWFKNGQQNGVYDSFNSLNMVGKYYMGEAISDILLMNEEIEGFKLSEFFKHTVFSRYSINDLKSFQEKGLNTMDEVYEQIYIPEKEKAKKVISRFRMLRAAGHDNAELSFGDTRIESFQIPGKKPHGDLLQLKLDGDYSFCAGYGMKARTGYSYAKTSNMANVNITNETMKKQIFTAIAYFQDECEKVAGRPDAKDWIDEAYLISQVWVWVALDGVGDAQLAARISQSIPNISDAQRVNLKDKVQGYLDNGRTKNDSDVYYYTTSVADAQPVITWTGPPTVEEKSAYIALTKTGSHTGNKIKGAVYGIYKNAACTDEVTTITTDDNGYGICEVKITESATFYVKEKSAPAGTVLNEAVYPVYVDINDNKSSSFPAIVNGDNGGTVTNVEVIPVYIAFTKTGQYTGNPIKGAVFGIYFDQACTDLVGTMTTDENGYASKQILLGNNYRSRTVYVKEITAPSGTLLNTTVYPIGVSVLDNNTPETAATIQYNNGTSGWVTNKEVVPVYIELTKVGEYTNKNIGGAVYGVYSEAACTNRLTTMTTDSNGYARASVNVSEPNTNLWVKEITAPKDTVLNTTVYPLTVNIYNNNTPETAVKVGGDNVKNIEILDAYIALNKIGTNTNAKIDGAVYGVYSNQACTDEVATITTNAEGYGISSAFKISSDVTYYVKEKTAPYNTVLNPTVYPVNVDIRVNSNKNTPAMVNGGTVRNDEKRGKILFEKYNDGNILVTTGGTARYRITAAEDIKVGTKIIYAKGTVITVTETNAATGKGESSLLLYGKYTVEEISAPTGYLLDSTIREITVNADTISYKQSNKEPTGTIEIIKRDAETDTRPQGDAVFEGAEYTLYAANDIYNKAGVIKHYNANQAVGTFKIKADGSSNKLANLPLGNYYAKETKAPVGYLLDTNVYNISLVYANQVTPVVTNSAISREQVKKRPLAIIKFVDYDIDQHFNLPKTPEEGAEFKVWLKSAGSYENAQPTERAVLVTDERGYAESIPLPYGLYRVQQTKGIADHKFVDDFDIMIDANTMKPDIIIAENLGISSRLRIRKFDAETKAAVLLPGTTFMIKDLATNSWVEQTYYYPSTVTINQFTADETGYVRLPEKLKTGWYEVHEVKAPDGYILNPQPVRFYIGQAEQGGVIPDTTGFIEVWIEDKPAKGKILINKTGDIYKGFDEEQHELIGTVRKPKFEKGKLAGVKFNIIAAEDIVTGDGVIRIKQGEIADTIITTEGNDYSKELYLGKYIIQEADTPEGYIKDNTAYEVELKYKDDLTDITISDVNIHNNWLSSVIEIHKEAQQFNVTKDGETVKTELSVKPGEGFIFALYTAEDIRDIPKDSAVAYGTTNKEGKLIFEGQFIHGNYYVQEAYVNKAYQPNSTKYPVNLTYNNGITRIEVSHNALNELITKKVTINKKDITGENPVPGAVIEIYNSQGSIVYKSVTDNNGQVKDIILLPGKYTFKETLAPNGYALNTNIYDFEITDSGEIKGNTSFKDDFNRIIFKKIGVSENNPLKGAKFGLFNTSYELIQEAVSDEGGIFTFEQMAYGEYIVKEIEAPDGYMRSEKEYRFTVDGSYVNTNEVQFVFENSKLIIITKTDITGENPVAGAEVEICDIENNTIYHAITDENGKLPDFQISKPGKYTFKETIAPSGYALNTNIYDFEITDSGEIKGDTGFKNDITRISLYKTDGKDGTPLSGAKFGLFNKKGELLEESITDINGLLEFSGMEYGKHTIKELEAPQGYKRSNKIITVYIDGTWENGEPIDFENSKLVIGNITGKYSKGNYNDGYKIVRTGDSNKLLIYLAISLSSISLIIFTCFILKKKKNKMSGDDNDSE